MSMNNTSELVFVPLPVMGHILSTVELAKLILERKESLSISVTIYILNPPFHSAKINAYVDSQSRDNPFPNRLTFVTFAPITTDDPITIEVYKPLIKQAVQDRANKVGFGKLAGFVLDMFYTGMVDIANELNVPSYIFITSGAASLYILLHAQSLADDCGIDVVTEFSDPGFSLLLPGFKNPVTSKFIPTGFKGNEICEELLSHSRKYKGTQGILVNTYMELESFVIKAMLNTHGKEIPPVYPVGPILELGNTTRGVVVDDTETKDTTIQWLDRQPKSSVVFLCFGSNGNFEEAQVKEIADGLERSGYQFLWVLRKPANHPNDNAEPFLEALPEGFLDRTTKRGKFIGWVSQVEVLAHPAVGGFVSHCGWNSILESLWFGVPIATWPIHAEQPINAFHLVKELELAIEIPMDYKLETGKLFTTAHEVEIGIKKLMSIDEKMKKNVRKMSHNGHNSLREGGSSYNSLGCFINDVSANMV